MGPQSRLCAKADSLPGRKNSAARAAEWSVAARLGLPFSLQSGPQSPQPGKDPG